MKEKKQELRSVKADLAAQSGQSSTVLQAVREADAVKIEALNKTVYDLTVQNGALRTEVTGLRHAPPVHHEEWNQFSQKL